MIVRQTHEDMRETRKGFSKTLLPKNTTVPAIQVCFLPLTQARPPTMHVAPEPFFFHGLELLLLWCYNNTANKDNDYKSKHCKSISVPFPGDVTSLDMEIPLKTL